MTIDPMIFSAAEEHVREELSSIRTGRAAPGLVENVPVEAYGGTMPVVQLATVSIQDNRTLVIQPWDKNLLKDVERALLQADLGMTPVNDGTVLRLTTPPLTEERRHEYIKLLNQKLESGRVAVRRIREDLLKQLKAEKQDGAIGEDEFARQQKELQHVVDGAIERINALGQAKETELMTV